MKKDQFIVELINKFIAVDFLSPLMRDNYLKRLKDLKQSVEERVFRIAVVGEFSSGKSTFLNAIIGKDILPHASTETTATVTYIYNVPRDDHRCNHVLVHFSDDTKEDLDMDFSHNPDELKNVLTCESAKFKVVEEISHVDIYTNFSNITEKVVLIDTPGLNGVAEGHREITLREIELANASICLFHIRCLAESNREYLDLLFKYQNSFIFVLNFIDQLKKSEGETYENKMVEFKNQLNQFYGCDPTGANYFGISALKALVYKDTDIRRLYHDDQADLNEAEREIHWRDSHFADFENHLWNDVVLKRKEAIFESSIRQKFLGIISNLEEYIENQRMLSRQVLNQKVTSEVAWRLKRIDSDNEANFQQIAEYIYARGRILEGDLRKEIPGDLNAIKQNITTIVQNDPPDKIKEALEKNLYGQQVSKKLLELSAKYNLVLSNLLESIYQGAVRQVQSFVGDVWVEVDGQITFTKLEKKDPEDNIADKLTRYKVEKEKFENEKEKLAREQARYIASQHESNQEIIELDLAIENTKNRQVQEVGRLGGMPDVEYRYVTKTKTVERAKISLFRLFGSTTKQVEYTEREVDTSSRDAWVEQRDRILNKYFDLNERYLAEKAVCQKRRNELLVKISHGDDRVRQLDLKINDLENRIYHTKIEYETEMEHAKEQYFKSQRFHIIHELEKIIAGSEQKFCTEIRENIQHNLESIKTNCKNYYDQLASEYKEKLLTLQNTEEKKAFDNEAADRLLAQLAVFTQKIKQI